MRLTTLAALLSSTTIVLARYKMPDLADCNLEEVGMGMRGPEEVASNAIPAFCQKASKKNIELWGAKHGLGFWVAHDTEFKCIPYQGEDGEWYAWFLSVFREYQNHNKGGYLSYADCHKHLTKILDDCDRGGQRDVKNTWVFVAEPVKYQAKKEAMTIHLGLGGNPCDFISGVPRSKS